MVKTEPRELTPRQMQILGVICRLHYEFGRMPTVRELKQGTGIHSENGVVCHLHALRDKGWLKLTEKKARGLQLLRTPAAWVLLPGGGIVPKSKLPELIAELEQKVESSYAAQ